MPRLGGTRRCPIRIVEVTVASAEAGLRLTLL